MKKERLNKFLAKCGVASRRKADELISAGKVKINGELVTKLGAMVGEGDEVRLDGRELKPEPGIIYALYKPKGVTSTVADRYASKAVVDLLPKGKRIYPVGRLDKDSEGLLLVTNDGDLANRLMHPRYEHEKEYEVLVEGVSSAVGRLSGVKSVNGAKIQPVKILSKQQVDSRCWQVNLVLKEGKKRQIREMAKQVGLKVKRLKRVRIGRLRLGNLAPRKWKIVTETDII